MQIEKMGNKCCPLSRFAEVFNPSIFKRQFCKSTPRSVQYFQSSDVPNAAEQSETFVSKSQAESLNLLVKKGDILITGFGTIGNTRLVSKFQDGVCYANNVCRVRVKPNEKTGYLYAFLSSKFGFSQLNKNASGSVVRYIEAPGIKRTLIPDFPEDFQQKIDDMIQESLRLREHASEAKNEAIHIVENLFPRIENNSNGKTNSKEIILSSNKRYEANFYISKGRLYDNFIKKSFEWKPLSELATVSRPGLFKRCYVENGLMFLGGADIFLAIPQSKKYVSRTKTADIPTLTIKEGMILMPRSGTIGNVAFATSQHAQKLASEDVIRIYSNNTITTAYIYAFLSSTIGKNLIQRYTFGSVIQHVEPHLLNEIPIPILENSLMEEIGNLSLKNKNCLGKAGELELSAIKMVEQEIEKWNN